MMHIPCRFADSPAHLTCMQCRSPWPCKGEQLRVETLDMRPSSREGDR